MVKRLLTNGSCIGVLWFAPGAWGEAEVRADSTDSQPAAPLLAKVSQSATEQTVEVVRWMAKRRQFTLRGIPYGVTGLPFAFFSPNTGWNWGARVHWADYRHQPYLYKLTLHVQQSSEGKLKNRLRLKVPRISGTDFGLRLELVRARNLRTRYYGLGNDSAFNRDFVKPTSSDFKDENYYYYILERNPRILVSLFRRLYSSVSMSVGLGLERVDVDQRGTEAFYLERGTPDGVIDGFSGFVSATLQWDTRDDEVLPRRGFFQEWSYESARKSLLALFFEPIDFSRTTLTNAYYIPLSPRVNFSHRLVLEVLSGEVPLYAYGEIGGSRRVKGLGGSDSLRGFDTQRFTDDVRFFSNVELRYQLYDRWFYGQYIEWQGMAFFDSGRVWPDLDRIGWSGMHFSGGAGVRMIWDADLVIRVGTGVANENEQMDIWLSLGQNF